MATGKPANSPYLEIGAQYDEDLLLASAQRCTAQAEAIWLKATKQTLANVERIRQTGEQSTANKVSAIQATAQAKYDAAEAAHQQRLRQMKERSDQQMILAAERAQQRMLAGHTTWSQKMVGNLEKLVAMGKAYIAIQLAMAIKGSVEYVTQLEHEAEAFNLTSAQMHAYTQEAARVGMGAEKIQVIFTKLNAALESPTDKQAGIFAKLGIIPGQTTNVQAFDTILQGLQSGLINTADAADLFSQRFARTMLMMSTVMGDTAAAMKEFPMPITDEQQQRLEKAEVALQQFWDKIKIGSAGAISGLIGAREAYIKFHYALMAAWPSSPLGPFDAWKWLGRGREYQVPAYPTPLLPLEPQGPPTGSETGWTAEQLKAIAAYKPVVIEDTNAWDDWIETQNAARVAHAQMWAGWTSSGGPAKLQSEVNALRMYNDALNKIADRPKEFKFPDPFGTRTSPLGLTTGPKVDIGGDIEKQIVKNQKQAEYIAGLLEEREAHKDNAQYLAAINKLLEEQGYKELSNVEKAKQWMQVAERGAMLLTSLNALSAVGIDNRLLALQREGEKQNELWQTEVDRHNQRIENLRAAGLENSAQYRNEVRDFKAKEDAQKKAETDRAKQEKKLQAQAWEADRRARYVSTVMTTANAVINAFTIQPVWLAPVMAALAGATGAVQLATISSQDNPYQGYYYGGWVNGLPGRDRNVISATNGEYVMPVDQARRNAETLEYMRQGGRVSAGQTVYVHIDTMVGTQEFVERTVIPAFAKAARNGVVIRTS